VRRTIIARTPEEISKLRYFWERLEVQPSTTMFQSFTWNSVAARVFAERQEPYIIYSAGDGGAAIIPACVDKSTNRVTLLGETLFDYRDVLCAGDDQALVSAWHRVGQLGLKFSVGALRSDSHLAAWSEFSLSRFYGAPRVSPDEITAEQFAAEHNRLARNLRRLQREGIELRCRYGTDSDLVRFIYERKGSQPVETGESLFADPLRREFMIEVTRSAGRACEIFTLESAGTLVAALVTFRDRSARRFYTVYFDERWAKHSPGLALVYEATCRSLRAGVECDYMTGEHSYKTRLATSIVPMFWAETSADVLAAMGEWQPAMAA
jgi:CelD/BcsL family acetyltransferase involved in cellulose biosynthesis